MANSDGDVMSKENLSSPGTEEFLMLIKVDFRFCKVADLIADRVLLSAHESVHLARIEMRSYIFVKSNFRCTEPESQGR